VKRSKKSKRGMVASTLGKFILVFLVVFALIILYSKTMRSSNKILECTANGGKCTLGTCDFGTQIPMLSDKAAGCHKDEICCVNVTQSKPPADPKCENKAPGTSCDTLATPTSQHLMYCDWSSQCVSRCDFCTHNFGTDEVEQKKICIVPGNANFNFEGYKCGCTRAECVDSKGVWKSNCISNYCPSNTKENTDYACCKP
jgi:hypothetical protein